MKKPINTISAMAVIIAMSFSLSSFKSPKPVVAADYSIQLISKEQSSTGQTWTWSLSNPNPGNGDNGTLQDVSHWSIPLAPAAEAALLSAEYSYDGMNWIPVNTTIERDPSIRACTGVDVLKFDMGTTGSQPTYYRASLNSSFNTNVFAFSYIKTGGGRQGCNLYFFEGIGTSAGSGGL